MTKPDTCPCGSEQPFKHCCQPIIANDSANTAEQLMRSRYTAFVLRNSEYLLKTWHADTCPADFKLGQAHWLGLKILHKEIDTVHFSAAFQSASKTMILEETSRFVCIDSHWRYVDGDCSVTTVKRNDPCFCGSTIKYKNCCGKRKNQ